MTNDDSRLIDGADNSQTKFASFFDDLDLGASAQPQPTTYARRQNNLAFGGDGQGCHELFQVIQK